MPQVIFKREEDIFNRFKRYKVYLNDDLTGIMFKGDTITRIVPEGENTIRVRMEWCGSGEKKFIVAEDQVKVFVIKTIDNTRIINSLLIFLLIIFFVFPPSFLNIPWVFNFTLVLSSILLFIYNLTIGRDRFLMIDELLQEPEISRSEFK